MMVMIVVVAAATATAETGNDYNDDNKKRNKIDDDYYVYDAEDDNDIDDGELESCCLRFFHNLLTGLWIVSNKYLLKWPKSSCVQITCNTLGAYHTLHVVCCMVHLGRVEITCSFNSVSLPAIWDFYYLLT